METLSALPRCRAHLWIQNSVAIREEPHIYNDFMVKISLAQASDTVGTRDTRDKGAVLYLCILNLGQEFGNPQKVVLFILDICDFATSRESQKTELLVYWENSGHQIFKGKECNTSKQDFVTEQMSSFQNLLHPCFVAIHTALGTAGWAYPCLNNNPKRVVFLWAQNLWSRKTGLGDKLIRRGMGSSINFELLRWLNENTEGTEGND